MIFAGLNIEDMEPIVMAYVRKDAPEGVWEDEGWGGFDTLGLLEGETNHPNRETGESGYLWQTDIPSSDSDFERLLDLVLENAEEVFDAEGKPLTKAKFKTLAMKTDPCFVAVSEALPD